MVEAVSALQWPGLGSPNPEVCAQGTGASVRVEGEVVESPAKGRDRKTGGRGGASPELPKERGWPKGGKRWMVLPSTLPCGEWRLNVGLEKWDAAQSQGQGFEPFRSLIYVSR